MKILKLPVSENVLDNRLDALTQSLTQTDPKYLIEVVDMLLYLLDDYEGYAAENAFYRLEEAKAWLTIGFDNEND